MRWNHHLFSVVQFFQVLLVILTGAFCLVLPSAPSLRIAISNWFLYNERVFFSIGIVFLVIGGVLAVGFYYLNRKTFLRVKMEPPASVESQVIADLFKLYLENKFPSQTFKTEAILDSKGALELISNLPSIPAEHLQKSLEEVEVEVGALLNRSLRYQKEFSLTFTE